MEQWKKEECIDALKLMAEKNGRLPKKSDFEVEEVARIKSFFGPWPRALEAAGVKEINKDRIYKKKQKRLRAKENRKRYREKSREGGNQ